MQHNLKSHTDDNVVPPQKLLAWHITYTRSYEEWTDTPLFKKLRKFKDSEEIAFIQLNREKPNKVTIEDIVDRRYIIVRDLESNTNTWYNTNAIFRVEDHDFDPLVYGIVLESEEAANKIAKSLGEKMPYLTFRVYPSNILG
jgi:hypothetical protein